MINPDANSPIAVFDSGVGGISVLRELVRIMPGEDFLFYGDTKNAPYGTKSKEEVRELTTAHVQEFMERGVKAVCIACNTATSAAVRSLRGEYPDFPIVGIEPAIKPASSFMEHPKILVMATPMTIREEKFKRLMARFEDKAEIHPLPCPGLMEYVERGKAHTPEIKAFLKVLLAEYTGEGHFGPMDAVVTGCTHYPFVAGDILEVLGEGCKLFDGAEGTAKEVKRRLEKTGILREDGHKGEVTFENSSNDEAKIRLCQKLLYGNTGS
ncbi:MAG: glutamate racemase [Lachnospiraceae bacterium]|nr:glutamate racemase [Lachnospiraceae bacterium]